MTKTSVILSINDLAAYADYSFLTKLKADPQSSDYGDDHNPRQVFSGHFVPVKPTPLPEPEYIAHSESLFNELNFDNSLATNDDFIKMFSGDLSQVPEPIKKAGWATGYALSIYGTEYTQQCPFRTGNGYGDGRAISIFETVIDNKRWEMQLKGAGRTPYCRGADGRAVLRSSVREFLAQEHMHALGLPTSRSLSLYVSKQERVDRPWYTEGSLSADPDIMVSNPVAISTRVAPCFLRVGQLELFARRARQQEHADALKELSMIVDHLIEREYSQEIDLQIPAAEKVIKLAGAFRERLSSLVTQWLRVGFCQGNFNSDNCAAGGYTLDYGPFGFQEVFDPVFQPWTSGGRHFSFLNQPNAAERNFTSFCSALEPLIKDDEAVLEKLEDIRQSFLGFIEQKCQIMWASKLGMDDYDSALFVSLIELMVDSSAEYNMLFRQLCSLPTKVSDIEKALYKPAVDKLADRWNEWLARWHNALEKNALDKNLISERMKRVNPKFTWREWQIVPAYQQASEGEYDLVRKLQQILTSPYDEQSEDITNDSYRLRPPEFIYAGGVSHYSCSS
ncbi:MAG: protein adenylyltransferase SelO family protein [Thalassotalea sp.]|nr:protein adenylyltransferase SelO family protein [Thalassotalea sp.]